MPAHSGSSSSLRATLILLAVGTLDLFARGAIAAPADSTAASKLRRSVTPTQSIALGQVFERTLFLERFRFRRDGDPLGNKGEVTAEWSAVPPITSPNYFQSGTLGTYKVKHSRRPKKCSDDGCTDYSDSDCRWLNEHDATYDDWSVNDHFCNPVSATFDFIEHDGSSHSRSIGKFETNGSSVPYLTSPTPSAGGTVTECHSDDIQNTLAGKPARIALQWNVQPKQFGALAGLESCVDTTGCGEIDRYQFGQMSGATFRCRMVLKTVNLNSTGFTGTRRIYFPFDTDNSGATGDPTPTLCGADYRVYLELVYDGSNPPTVTPFIEVYNSSGSSWSLTAGVPLDIQINGKVVDCTVLKSDIGNPTSIVTSWSVFEQNNITAGLMPCNPCVDRLLVPLSPDTQCPVVLGIGDAALVGGDEHAALTVHFSEPMGTITTSDLAVVPPLPGGTSLVVAQNDALRGLLVSASPAWPPGERTITLLSTIHDQAGNLLASSQSPGVCGATVDIGTCIDDSHLTTANSTGTPLHEVAAGTPVYVVGDGFPASASLNVYLLQEESLDRIGGLLVDFTTDGPTVVSTNALGQIPVSAIGVPVAKDDYGLVVDMNGDGLLDAGDRLTSHCNVGLNVGPPCDDGPGPPYAVWSMDQKTGVIAGERARGWHGTIDAPATWTTGILNGALSFNGSSTRVTVPNDPDLWFLDTDFSITAWLKTSAATGTIIAHLGATGTGFKLELAGGKPSFTLVDGSGSSVYAATGSPSFADGAWHLLSVTVDRGSTTGLNIYRDQTLVLTGNPKARAGSIAPSAPLTIGARTTGAPYFAGTLDEVMLFDEALTHLDVDQIQLGPFRAICPDSGTVSVGPDLPPDPGATLARPRILPNPTHAATLVEYSVPQAGWVNVELFDVSGRQVAKVPPFFSPSGAHQLALELRSPSGGKLPPGVYHVVIRWGGQRSSRAVVLLP